MTSSTPRWLAVYADDNGSPRAAMITPSDPASFPFGFDGLEAFLPDYNSGCSVALVEMPGDTDFRPLIVDWAEDEEAPLCFIDL